MGGKTINKQKILSHIFSHPGATRSNIRNELSLRRNNLAEWCRELVNEKSIVEINPGNRKNIHLKVNPEKFLSVGVEHIENGFYYCILDAGLEFRIKKFVMLPMSLTGRERCRMMASEIKKQLANINHEHIIKIGFADIGTIDKDTGKSIRSALIAEWEQIPIREIFMKETGIDVTLYLQSEAHLLNETCFGAARDIDNVLFILISSGIGLAVLSDGEQFRLNHSVFGELGHTIVKGNDLICKCGNRGCLETIASLDAVREKVISNAPNDIELKIIRKEDINIEMILQYARKGNKLANLVIEEAANAIGDSLANMVSLFGINTIIIESKLTLAGDIFNNTILQKVKKNAVFPLNKDANIIESADDEYSGAAGAAFGVMQDYFSVFTSVK